MANTLDLPQLQNLIKRDPDGYLDDFLSQKRAFEAQLEVFLAAPGAGGRAFGDACAFMAQVSYCYPQHMADFPARLGSLLEAHASAMPQALRRSLVSALILMRNRNQVTPTALLGLFFTLFRVRDKQMRKTLHAHIVSDVRGLNAKGRNNKVNTAMQNFMYTMLADTASIAAKKSLDVMMELYRRGVWTDARTVNVIASACLSSEPRLIVACLKFFLGVDGENADDDEDDDEVDPQMIKELQDSVKQKLTKKKKKHAQKLLEKAMKGKGRKKETGPRDFAALQLIRDPQTFAEKLFARVKRSAGSFDARVMALTLISRLIGIHRLIVLNFYPYLLRYISPHSPNVTVLMAVLAQATHDMVPPDALTPVVAHIVDHFVSNKSSDLAVALGINTIRELCSRAPLCMDRDTLSDLAANKTSRNRSISAAAKSLIALFRELDPGMLAKRDRGKEGALRLVEGGVRNRAVVDETEGLESGVRPARFGEQLAATAVDGLDLLQEYEATHAAPEAGVDGWEDADASAESSGGWIDVSDDDGAILLSDSDSDSDSESGSGSGGKRKRKGKNADADGDADGDGDGDGDGDAKGKAKGKPRASADESAADAAARALRDRDRILTPADFERLKLLKAKKRLETALGSARTKRQRELIEAQASDIAAQVGDPGSQVHQARDAGEKVDPDALEGPRKKTKMDHAQRMEHAKAGREDRGQFGSKLSNRAKDGGTSNTEKLRSKPFLLVRHARRVADKKKMSFRDKQKSTQLHKSNQWRQKNKSGK